jgi:hypothetical protein
MPWHDLAMFVAGLIQIGILAVIVLAVLVSRAPLRAFARRTGRLKRGGAGLDVGFDATPDFNKRLGASAFAGLTRMFRGQSLIETALEGVDEGFERTDGRDSGPWDFKANEEKNLKRGGILFRWINVKPSYMPDTAILSDELAEIYHKAASRFFSGQVNISADIASLYEDVDAATTVRMFRVRDRRGFYLLNEMRRMIDDNVRKLAFLYVAIVLAVLLAAWFVIPELSGGGPAAKGVVGFLAAQWHASAWGLLFCALGLFLMWLTYFMEYVPNQRNNAREMRSFLSRYMSRLSDRYRDSLANARAVTVGDETDSAKLSAKAQKWHKIVLWMSFRAFFMESFVRNVLFQIGRNCGYYVVLVPLVLTGLTLFWAMLSMLVFRLDPFAVIGGPGLFFYIGFAVVVLVALVFLVRAMRPIDEMNQADWLGFDDFDVDRGMDQVVGKYAEDVGYWKGRLDR